MQKVFVFVVVVDKISVIAISAYHRANIVKYYQMTNFFYKKDQISIRLSCFGYEVALSGTERVHILDEFVA